MAIVLFEACARLITYAMGCEDGAVCILVKACRTLFLIGRWGGSKAGSISSDEVAVVQNAPKIAFIAVLCAVSSFVRCRCVIHRYLGYDPRAMV